MRQGGLIQRKAQRKKADGAKLRRREKRKEKRWAN